MSTETGMKVPKANRKLAKVSVSVVLESSEVMRVEGYVDLKGYGSNVLLQMKDSAIDALIKAAVLKLTPSLKSKRPDEVRRALRKIVDREDARAKAEKQTEADEEMIVVDLEGDDD